MITKRIKSGTLIYPADWIELVHDMPEESEYICAFEVHNADELPVLFFCSKSPLVQISEEDENKLIHQACALVPGFREALNAKVEPVRDSNGHIINAEEFLAAPVLGLYPVCREEERIHHPYGAFIKSNNSIK